MPVLAWRRRRELAAVSALHVLCATQYGQQPSMPLRVSGFLLLLLQVLGDATGKVMYGVTSAVEADGKLFLGTIRRKGVPVLDLKAIQ